MNSRWIFRRRSWIENSQIDSDRTGQNPARGFYRVYTYDITEKEAEEDWVWALQKEERLALVLLDIGKCADRALSEQELAKAARIFSLFREHRMQMLVRVVYDRNGHGMKCEPHTIGQVLEHMRQFAPLFVQFAADIFTVQGLFIGSWGEMHDSRFLGKEHLRLLYQTLQETTGGCVRISVRKPQYQRILCNADGSVCTGLFDDAILGSETDMGTYGWVDDCTDREIMWTPQAELAFIEKQSAYTPCGGEVLAGALALPFEQAVCRMRRMQLTYLNRVHEPVVWESWGGLPCDMHNDKATFGLTRLDYIRSHLGYRYVLEDILFSHDASMGDVVQIVIKNSGFACCYDSLRLILAIGEKKLQMSLDGKILAAGGVQRMTFAVGDVLRGLRERNTLAVSLALYHEKTGLPIYFANEFSDARRWSTYRSSSSFSEGMIVGVLSIEKDAVS